MIMKDKQSTYFYILLLEPQPPGIGIMLELAVVLLNPSRRKKKPYMSTITINKILT